MFRRHSVDWLSVNFFNKNYVLWYQVKAMISIIQILSKNGLRFFLLIKKKSSLVHKKYMTQEHGTNYHF